MSLKIRIWGRGVLALLGFIFFWPFVIFLMTYRPREPTRGQWDVARRTNNTLLPGYSLPKVESICATRGGTFAADVIAERAAGEPSSTLEAVAHLSRAAVVSTDGGDFVDIGETVDAGTAVQLHVVRALDACGRSIWVFTASPSKVPDNMLDAYRVRTERMACNATSAKNPKRVAFLRVRSCEHDCVMAALSTFSGRLADNAIVLSECYHASNDVKAAVDRFRYEHGVTAPINSIQEPTRLGKSVSSGAWWQKF